MRTFRLLTGGALLAGLCWSPLVRAADAPTDHTPPTHADGDGHEPKVRFCDSDKDRDALRDQLKHMDEKHRHEFLARLRRALEERRQRLDHLEDVIRDNPNLSDQRKHEILETIEKLRKQIRDRMDEFRGDEKDRAAEHKDRFEFSKVGDRIGDLKKFIANHPCLTDGEKKALLDKLADLKDERSDERNDLKKDHPDGDAGNATRGSRKDGADRNNDNDGALSSADMLALQQKMAAISAQHQAEHQADQQEHKDIHQDVQQIQTQKQTLASDKSADNSAAIKQDKQALHQDQKDLRKDVRDARSDDHPLASHDGDHDGGKVGDHDGDKDAHPFLTDEQRARLRTRIEAFIKVHGDGTHDAHPELTDTQRKHLRDLLQGIRDHRNLEFHHKIDFDHDKMGQIVDGVDFHQDHQDGDHTDSKSAHPDHHDLHPAGH